MQERQGKSKRRVAGTPAPARSDSDRGPVRNLGPAHDLGFHDALEADHEGGHAERHIASLRQGHHLLVAGSNELFELRVDILFIPAELLEILDPLEVGDDDTAGVGQDIRHHRDAFVGLGIMTKSAMKTFIKGEISEFKNYMKQVQENTKNALSSMEKMLKTLGK